MLNRTAKQWLKTGGVVDLSNELRQRKLMVIMPVEEVLADDYPNHLELLELIRYYSNLASTQLEIPTNDTRDIVKRVLPCLDKIWQTDNRYEKAGIVLGDFYDKGVSQLNLFDELGAKAKQ
ncbi:hypothetical protein [Hafnia alvei]|uniref:DinB/UmuC family translesion DNA polymerase n=1 Tax=Hafnia alvei TaxID=569 RepID=UPI000E07BA9F|nr:hypothetical protein [Hafnia alvei]STQ71432.1 DNA polymerase V subunit UmuC [Hafnia alvei]